MESEPGWGPPRPPDPDDRRSSSALDPRRAPRRDGYGSTHDYVDYGYASDRRHALDFREADWRARLRSRASPGAVVEIAALTLSAAALVLAAPPSARARPPSRAAGVVDSSLAAAPRARPRRRPTARAAAAAPTAAPAPDDDDDDDGDAAYARLVQRSDYLVRCATRAAVCDRASCTLSDSATATCGCARASASAPARSSSAGQQRG